MPAKFSEAKTRPFWNAYLDWSAAVRNQNMARQFSAEDDLWEPIFVETDLSLADLADRIRADGDLVLSPIEEAIATQRGTRPDLPLELFLYSRVKKRRARNYFVTRHVGAPIHLAHGKAPKSPLPRLQGIFGQSRVALGIIDDGIGYLNARFCKLRSDATRETRFGGVWLQAGGTKSTETAIPNFGVVLNGTAIDCMLTGLQNSDESAVYRKINSASFAAGTHQTINQMGTHGTHMLDLCAGLNPDQIEALADVPIFAVQLPSDSVDDTSGIRLETDFLMGFRWLIQTARLNGIEHLVVNASLGVLAGPKNGTKFIEQQIAREIELARPMVVEIVLPFGSEHETRQVARVSPRKPNPSSTDFIVQRQDLTPSYIEIRATDASRPSELESLHISLTLPDGSSAGPIRLREGQFSDLVWHDRVVGRLYHVARRPGAANGKPVDSYLTLALAPTVPFHASVQGAALHADDYVAPPGRWRLTLATHLPQAQDYVLQIQRDDSAVGYRTRGRQACFDDAAAHDWNPHRRNYSLQGPGCALQYEGTNNAYATIGSAGAFAAGAAQVVGGRGHVMLAGPASYASKGAAWSVRQPQGAAVAELTPGGGGITASGSRSGSAVRLSGSSTAAATFSRSRVLQALNAPALPEKTLPPDDMRLGQSVVLDNPAIRRRG